MQVETADAKVIEAYEAKGLNGQRALARIIGGRQAEPETLDYWREEEIKELMREGDVPRTVATREIDDLQKFASGTYREAERQIERGVDRDPQNEVERDRPDDARRSAEQEAMAAERVEPETAREAPGQPLEIVEIDPDTGLGLVSSEALRAQVQRDATEIAKAQAEKNRERGIDRGLDLDFD